MRILQGNQGKIKLNGKEPEPAKAPLLLEPPSYLTQEARQVFSRLRSELPWLTVVDLDIFAGYCQAFARWREAEDFITARGMMFVVRDGPKTGNKAADEKRLIKYIQQYPQVAIARHYFAQMLSAGAALGLSPAARTRIQIGDTPPKSPSEREAQDMFG